MRLGHIKEVGAGDDPKVVQSKAILAQTSNRFLMSLKAMNLKPSALHQVVCSSSRITRRNVDSICPAVMAWWRAWLMNVWYRIAAARSGLAANRNQGYLTRPRPSRFA
jgi:hypothetical protein